MLCILHKVKFDVSIWYFSALTAPHRYGYGEYPVASPDMVSLGDISINMQGFARYPLVKAHGKEILYPKKIMYGENMVKQ